MDGFLKYGWMVYSDIQSWLIKYSNMYRWMEMEYILLIFK